MQFQKEAEHKRNDRMHHDLGVRLIKVFNLLLITLPFALCWLGYYSKNVVLFAKPFQSAAVIAMFMVLYYFFGRVYDAFLISLKRISEMFFSQVLGFFMADFFMFLVLWLMMGSFPDLRPALIAFVAQSVFSCIWCKRSHIWYFSRFSGQKTGIVFDERRDMEDLIGEYGMNKKFDVCFACSVGELLSQQMRMLDDVANVFLCGVHSHDRNAILKYCVAHGINVYMIPRIGDLIMSSAKRMHMFHLPILRVSRYNPPIEYVILKRMFDILGSLLAILLTGPVMIAVAIAIKACDGGPVFYRQTRLTRDGRQFEMLKFRSMRTDAEKDGVARLSSGEQDDRITPVGHFIRACRLDELPQLFNILGGSMSVVGPRPERPEIAAQYEKELPEFSLRLQAKAGLTGYAQVYGKYNTLPYDKLQMDLMYIANPSIIGDFKIILATIKILFMKESTEGVALGQITAMKADKDEKSA